MDVREKLVELLQDENNPVWRLFPNNMAMLQLADYLISNGVTVKEWILVDDRLQEPLLYQSPKDNKPSTTRILREGRILKANTFDTAKGCYTIRIVIYKGNLYFHKMLNGKVVELVNLSKLTIHFK